MRPLWLFFFGILAVLTGLFEISNAEFLLFAFLILAGIGLIIYGVYEDKGYNNKTYYLAFFSLIGLMGLVLIYTFLFIPTTNKYYFYPITVAVIVLLIIFSYSYHNRYQNISRPWKDSW